MNRKERRATGRRFSAVLAEVEREVRQAAAIADKAAQRLVGAVDAQEALKPELDAITAAVRQVTEQRTQAEALEEFLLSGRQVAEWATRLVQAGNAVVQAHPKAPPGHLAEIKEVQTAAQTMIRLLKKRGLAAADTPEEV